ncbi:MAG: hypothetical protein AAGA66_02710 [Bacteroidota bacterium]
MTFYFTDTTEAIYKDKHFAIEAVGGFDVPATDCLYVTLYVTDAQQQTPQTIYHLDLFNETQCERLCEQLSEKMYEYRLLHSNTIYFSISLLISFLQPGYSEA